MKLDASKAECLLIPLEVFGFASIFGHVMLHTPLKSSPCPVSDRVGRHHVPLG